MHAVLPKRALHGTGLVQPRPHLLQVLLQDAANFKEHRVPSVQDLVKDYHHHFRVEGVLIDQPEKTGEQQAVPRLPVLE